MKSLITLLSFVCLSLPAQAFDTDFAVEDLDFSAMELVERGHHGGGNGHHHKKNPCKKVGFSKVQKHAAHIMRANFKKDTKKVRARLKKLKKRYHDVLIDTQWSGDYADALVAKMAPLKKKFGQARADLFHSFVYDIATDAQRVPLLKCVRYQKMHMLKMKLKKMHDHHHGGSQGQQ